MRFGEKVRALRLRDGLTLAELAEKIGLRSHSYLSELEGGRKVPTSEMVLKLARFFEVSTDSLLKDEIEVTTEGGSG